MNMKFLLGAACTALLGASSLAAAQVSIVATETFEYPVNSMLHMQTGGVGWFNEWFVGVGQSDILLFDSTATPAFTLDDGIGVYAGQVVPFGEGYRKPDAFAHPEITAGGFFGDDNSTIWISFSTVLIQGTTTHFGGLSLIEQGVGEQLFIGSPWMSNGWGIDDEGPNGAAEVIVPASDNTMAARIVARIDFLSGMERVRLYVNPSVPYPTTAPDLDEMVHDFLWDEIRIASGGNGGEGFYFDAIEIAKGDPNGSVGTNYCGPGVANSAGLSGKIRGLGSSSVMANSMAMEAFDLPPNAFGFFITSQTQGFVPGPGNSLGNLCLSGAIGRYVGPGQIQNSGPMGSFSLPIDLLAIPQPTGFVSVTPGQTWNFQTWHRDFAGGMATSNFTDGTSVMFTM